jgi:RNA polymerase sigma factor (TIGR02999 family)
MSHSQTTHDSGALARLLRRAETGEPGANDQLFAALYDELHRLAQAHIHRGAGNVTLGATTLLHEAYLDMSQRSGVAFPDRNRFLGYASRAMRGLVIDYVRNRGAQKRGGDLTFTTLADRHAMPAPGGVTLDRLDAALVELAEVDPPLAQLVDLKFFCGFSFTEIAAMRDVSERSVHRDWAKARALLRHLIADD